MKIYRLFFLVIIFNILIGCVNNCRLKPISKNVFDLNKISKSVNIHSQNEEDRLILVEKLENYEKSSYKGLLNYRECEHFKSYEYRFRNGDIFVSVRKNDEDSLELEVLAFGSCPNFDSVKVTENELLSNKEFIFEKDNDCSDQTSTIKKVVLQGYNIKSFVTSDDITWSVN